MGYRYSNMFFMTAYLSLKRSFEFRSKMSFKNNAIIFLRLSKHVLSAQDTGSFLAITLGLVLVKIKRNFDRFMEAQKRSIEEARAPRRNKCGILAFVSNFEKFSDTTETIFKSSERRSDLEKWYTSLVMEMVIHSLFILNFIYLYID